MFVFRHFTRGSKCFRCVKELLIVALNISRLAKKICIASFLGEAEVAILQSAQVRGCGHECMYMCDFKSDRKN
jgi:hypothetical protein